MGFRLRAATVRGPAHIAEGLPNQDAVLIRNRGDVWFAAVSDGMGSRKRADVGAKAACWAGWQSVRRLSFGCADSEWVELCRGLWVERLAAFRVEAADAVATCLFAWGLPDGRFRLAQLGDGLILGDPEPARGLVGRDPGDFANETMGLGLAHETADWAFARGELKDSGQGLALMTDGISEDLGSTDGLVRSVLQSLRGRGARSARVALSRELEAWPTPHHGDDKSIAIIYRV